MTVGIAIVFKTALTEDEITNIGPSLCESVRKAVYSVLPATEIGLALRATDDDTDANIKYVVAATALAAPDVLKRAEAGDTVIKAWKA